MNDRRRDPARGATTTGRRSARQNGHAPVRSRNSRAALSVLVVDDDAEIRELLASNLRKVGYAVRAAADGQKALDQIIEQQPNVILLDLSMPVMDGSALVAALKERGVLIPVVVLSAAHDRPAWVNAPPVVANLYKPSTIDDVLACLKQISQPANATRVATRPK